jgi:hypothetical protein
MLTDITEKGTETPVTNTGLGETEVAAYAITRPSGAAGVMDLAKRACQAVPGKFIIFASLGQRGLARSAWSGLAEAYQAAARLCCSIASFSESVSEQTR